MALKGGAWYLVALVGDKPRTYRVSAIQTLALSGESFSRPEGFDLSAWWTAWAKDFETRVHRGEASLRLSPKGLERLPLLSRAAGEMAALAAGAPDEAGWVRVNIPIESIDHAAGEMLKLGVEAEVLTPPELRRRMVEIVARLSAIYPAGT